MAVWSLVARLRLAPGLATFCVGLLGVVPAPGEGGEPQRLSGVTECISPQDGSEDPSTNVMQKTPIILSKPPAERVSVSGGRREMGEGRREKGGWRREEGGGKRVAGGRRSPRWPAALSLSQSKPPPASTAPVPAPAPAPLEKPIVLMKPREEGKGPAAGAGSTAPEGTTPSPPTAATPPKGEKEGQRPTQPVYQIQNRGMGTATPTAMDREWTPRVGRDTSSWSLSPSLSCLRFPSSCGGPGQAPAPGAYEAQHQAGGRPDELV